MVCVLCILGVAILTLSGSHGKQLIWPLAIGDGSPLSKVGTASWGNPMPVFLSSTGSVLQFCLWISDIMFYPCFTL
jgi:hypothetical protein